MSVAREYLAGKSQITKLRRIFLLISSVKGKSQEVDLKNERTQKI